MLLTLTSVVVGFYIFQNYRTFLSLFKMGFTLAIPCVKQDI